MATKSAIGSKMLNRAFKRAERVEKSFWRQIRNERRERSKVSKEPDFLSIFNAPKGRGGYSYVSREERRLERERIRLEKENERLQKQTEYENEVSAIIEENKKWTTLHVDVTEVTSESEFQEEIELAKTEMNDIELIGLFTDPMPNIEQCKKSAENESNSIYKFDEIDNKISEAKSKLAEMTFTEIEPTLTTVTEALRIEAKNAINAFWPWTKNKLIKQYVDDHVNARFDKEHGEWQKNKEQFLEMSLSLQNEIENLLLKKDNTNTKKTTYIENRTKELFDSQMSEWKQERENYYTEYIDRLQNLLDGNQDIINDELHEFLNNRGLPMQFFVNFMYEPSLESVQIDLDLPEIEDVPTRKIGITPLGKQSIQKKTQKEINEDYANYVSGIAIYLAEKVFDVSPVIKNVLVSGYTQRTNSKSHMTTDQYIFYVNFDRDTFNMIKFNTLSAIQAFNFFHHHMDMTKTLAFKEIDIEEAEQKAELFHPFLFM